MSPNNSTNHMILSRVAMELESMRDLALVGHSQQPQPQPRQSSLRPMVPRDDGTEFPTAARHLLYSLPGNHMCMDCGAAHPTWASVSFGTLLCLQCSGQHRGWGVRTSRVRSVELDTWSHAQVLAMLEGGNGQLQQFFDRHGMGKDATPCLKQRRYHTKAAQFYRVHLAQHVEQVAAAGMYQGREATRPKQHGHGNATTATSTTTTNTKACATVGSESSSQPRSIAVAQ